MVATEGMRGGLEIRSALEAFVGRWSGFAGTERAEAQTYLNELFACYGFILPEIEATALLARTDALYRSVVRPYLTGDDIANDPGQRPTRWIIDFAQLPLEAAAKYPAALAILRDRVKSVRDENARKLYRERWWQLGEPRPGMRVALGGLPRYIASLAQGKRLLLAWQEPWTCPSNLTNVFAFDDDFSMGVLSSRIHSDWAWARASTLKGDLRYTPTSVVMTFPWPTPAMAAERDRVAAASCKVIARRQEICSAEQIGLTKLYNLIDEGAYADLRSAQLELDEAVAAAYGWPKQVAQDEGEIVHRLLALNAEIAGGRRDYAPFGTARQIVQPTLDAYADEVGA
jgi:hypothetical protein